MEVASNVRTFLHFDGKEWAYWDSALYCKGPNRSWRHLFYHSCTLRNNLFEKKKLRFSHSLDAEKAWARSKNSIATKMADPVWWNGEQWMYHNQYSKLAFQRTQHFGARLGSSLRQAKFLSYALLLNRAFAYFQMWFFSKISMLFTSGWHVLNDFRLEVLPQYVLRNVS